MKKIIRCSGTLQNGPEKRYSYCSVCGQVDYDGYEGDRCRTEKWVTNEKQIVAVEGWAAIRFSSDGYKWIDMDSFSGDLHHCKQKAAKADERIPAWSQANKVVSYNKIVCTTEVFE